MLMPARTPRPKGAPDVITTETPEVTTEQLDARNHWAVTMFIERDARRAGAEQRISLVDLVDQVDQSSSFSNLAYRLNVMEHTLNDRLDTLTAEEREKIVAELTVPKWMVRS